VKLLYPASNDLASLPEVSTSTKISRYVSCEVCEGSSSGLRPPYGSDVVRDDLPKQPENSLSNLVEYDSDDEDGPTEYLHQCSCGHDTKEHGADPDKLGREEFGRRAEIAVRLEQRLEASGNLLDFDYIDTETETLRSQFKLPEPATSPL
ncbi:hypothetical protein HETIRDRAFT_243540, partial [Heterobasidion irregulare TC 32-1]